MALAFMLCIIGFSMLALSMEKHRRTFLGRRAKWAGESALRAAGYAVLLLSLVLGSIGQGYGLGMGIVLWLGIATVAALAVAMALTYGPRRAPSGAPLPSESRAATRSRAEAIGD